MVAIEYTLLGYFFGFLTMNTCLECDKVAKSNRCGAGHMPVYCSAKCQQTASETHMELPTTNKNDGAAKKIEYSDCLICIEPRGEDDADCCTTCCGCELCRGCMIKLAGPQCAFCRMPDTVDQFELSKRCRKRADAGRAADQWSLSVLYYYGKGVVQDYIKSAQWLRLAADQGVAKAQFRLGYSYFSGEGVVRDYIKSARWFRLAADQGHAPAQLRLSTCYFKGEGVARDSVKAICTIRLAAYQGFAEAQNNLGVCYYEGRGLVRDVVEAARWFRLAANQGYATAQYNLATCYLKGDGVAPDLVQAKQWLTLAAQQGHEQAKEHFRSAQKAIEEIKTRAR
jgi:TPR repeat protein